MILKAGVGGHFDDGFTSFLQLILIVGTVAVEEGPLGDERDALAVTGTEFDGDQTSVSRVQQLGRLPFGVHVCGSGHRVQFDEQHDRARLVGERREQVSDVQECLLHQKAITFLLQRIHFGFHGALSAFELSSERER